MQVRRVMALDHEPRRFDVVADRVRTDCVRTARLARAPGPALPAVLAKSLVRCHGLPIPLRQHGITLALRARHIARSSKIVTDPMIRSCPTVGPWGSATRLRKGTRMQ